MICYHCLHDFPQEELVITYVVINSDKNKLPEPHSGLCAECYKNPPLYNGTIQ